MTVRAATLFLLIAAVPAAAADREVIKTNWSEFQTQASSRHLVGRTARIRLAGGEEVKAKVTSVSDSGLTVPLRRATRQWASGKEAVIPKTQIRSVAFEGRTGHRGLIGAVAGLAAGLAIGTVAAYSTGALDSVEGPAIIAAPVAIAAGSIGAGVAGYYIGRATAPGLPEFDIQP